MVSNEERFVVVRTFTCPAEAHLAKNLLEEEGISVILEGEETAGTLTGLSSGLSGGARVLVPSADAAKAVGILADLEARIELPGDWEHEATRGYVCLLCGEPVEEGRAECPACRTPCESIVPAVRVGRPVPPPGDDAIKSAPAAHVTAKPAGEQMAGAERRPGPGCLWALGWLLPF